jgi:opacity protein-like surface antigen
MKKLILAILLLPAGPAAKVAAQDVSAKPVQPAKPAVPAEPAKPAVPNARVRLFVNGASTPGSIDFAQSRTFRQYAEDGQASSQYSAGSGLGFEAGVHYRFKPRLGAMLSVATASRDGALSYSATVPHPLYLDRARTVSGTQEGLSLGETTIHLDFVYQIESGAFEILFFAGPSRVALKTDVLSRLDYEDAYPYDEVSVSGVSLTEVSDSAFGVSFGAGLDYRFGKSRKFGIGAQVRYTTASATVAPPEGPTIDVATGGFQAAVGVRLSF